MDKSVESVLDALRFRASNPTDAFSDTAGVALHEITEWLRSNEWYLSGATVTYCSECDNEFIRVPEGKRRRTCSPECSHTRRMRRQRDRRMK